MRETLKKFSMATEENVFERPLVGKERCFVLFTTKTPFRFKNSVVDLRLSLPSPQAIYKSYFYKRI